MSLAIFGAYRLLNPLQNVVRGFMPAQALQSTSARHLPLRVARVVDAQQTRQTAGRMVISGRMADVCAELDRLAELESRH
jgi:phospholipase C